MMTQTWDPQAYERNGAFVHGLAGGVLEWLKPQKGERILDLGCGDGQLTQRIAATGAVVSGVDASPEMVAAARSRGVGSTVRRPRSCRLLIGIRCGVLECRAALGARPGRDDGRGASRAASAGALWPRWAGTATSPPFAWR